MKVLLKKFYFDLRILETRNQFHWAERDSLRFALEENASTVPDEKRKTVEALSTLGACYVELASKVLLELPKLCAEDEIKLVSFESTYHSCWLRCVEVVENLGAKVASGVFVEPFLDDTLVFTAKYLTSSSEIGKEFLALTVVEKYQKGAWQRVFLTTDEKKYCIESFFVWKGLQFK